MDQEEIKQYLKENLQIWIDREWDWGTERYKVSLVLEGEIISSDTIQHKEDL